MLKKPPIPTETIELTVAKSPMVRQSFKQRWSRHPRRNLIILGAALVLVGAGVAYGIYQLTQPDALDSTPLRITKKPVVKYYSPLTGVEVADQAATEQAVTAIMIENSPDARPHSGLKQAGVVYEAIAEGGITRFLALYQESKPQMIGPVRSLRMYYVDWLAPYNASVAHVGGSAAALAEIRNGSYRDIDEFANGGYYWRARDRYAPHNLYTSFAKLDELNQAKGFTSSSFTGFARTDGKPSEAPTASVIDINFSSALFNTHYDYDAATNTYHRSIGGQPSLDREDGQITPSVVVAMKVDMVHVMEDGWRESITTVGAGPATIFQNGTATDCTWRKNSRTEPLQFIDAEGNEIPLNRGQTWIAAVPNGTGSVAWQ